VVVGVDNNDLRLKPGMTANVSIVVAQKDHVIKVPNAALRFMPPKGEGERRGRDGQAAKVGGGHPIKASSETGLFRTVWKQTESGELSSISVRMGISDGAFTEVLSGEVTEGDAIVVGIEQPFGERKGSELPPGFGAQQRPRSR
jgi:HlyD family secretion protein